MKFELIPIIDTMIDFYEKPRSIQRFQEYIATLQGDTKGDLALPISGFNPMAKEHVLHKLIALKELNAEQLITDTLNDLNTVLLKDKNSETFKIVLNLADDLKGGWTNRFTTGYDSKFKLNALISRRFCSIFFWASETYNAALVKQRTRQYLFRTIYWLKKPKPETLEEHIEQEIFVAQKAGSTSQNFDHDSVALLDNFYSKNKHTTDYSIIFNFLYGDKAAKSLEFPTYGITDELTGFDYAAAIAAQRKAT